MVSEEAKAARAAGQAQGRTVSRYLTALDSTKPKRGRQRSTEKMQARVAELPDEIAHAKPLKRVHLIQELMDLEAELAKEEETVDISGVESEFIAIAAEYSDRKGISHAAWREVGVPASVLKAAGVSRTRSTD
ncbi:MAG: hypothetical protein OXG30_02780 [bacterium]|nr:hypothetical protein [bacterium]MCY3889017.1 hypothetical protein [bacterium]MCY4133825.1 hypothetical protein [bacterium]